MEGVVVPTVSNIPQPCLIPQTVGTIHQDKGIEHTPEKRNMPDVRITMSGNQPPSSLAELLQGGW